MLLACSEVFADDYRILLINNGVVRIEGKTVQKGDTFSDKDDISWENERQAIKAINLSTRKSMVLTAAQMKKADCSSLLDYAVFVNQMSVRDYVRSYSSTEQYLLDTLTLTLPVSQSEVTNIKMVYSHLGKRVSKNLPMSGCDVIVTRTQFSGVSSPSVMVNVECLLKNDSEPLPLIEDMAVHLL